MHPAHEQASRRAGAEHPVHREYVAISFRNSDHIYCWGKAQCDAFAGHRVGAGICRQGAPESSSDVVFLVHVGQVVVCVVVGSSANSNEDPVVADHTRLTKLYRYTCTT